MTMDIAFVGVAILLGLASTGAMLAFLARDRPTMETFPSATPREAVDALLHIIGRAESRIDILGGELGILSGASVADALEAKLRQNGSFRIRILGGPRLVGTHGGRHETYERWKQMVDVFAGRFVLRFAAHDMGPHFILVDDGEALIVEEPHDRHYWPRRIARYARPFFAAPRFSNYFEELWRAVPTLSEPILEPWPDSGDDKLESALGDSGRVQAQGLDNCGEER